MARPDSRARSYAASRTAHAQSGRVPLWIVLGILASSSMWFLQGLTEGVRAAGFERIDPRSSKLAVEAGFVDPRWNELLAGRLATLPAMGTEDREGIRSIARTVAALPFVAEVGEPRVLWPDGVDVPLRLRTPAASILQGNEFLAVAEDGTILPGRWPTPPWIDTGGGHVGFLPVIGPNDGAFDDAQPGDRLSQNRHRDALAIAISMRAALTEEDFALLGPPLIDATEARRASTDVPGVVLRLEGRREVYFGRVPDAGMPGERPTASKWSDLRRAATFLRGLGTEAVPDTSRDWSFLDVRWDTSDITWRLSPEEAAAAAEAEAAAKAAKKSGGAGKGAGDTPKKPGDTSKLPGDAGKVPSDSGKLPSETGKQPHDTHKKPG
jgi:hypothetical protein